MNLCLLHLILFEINKILLLFFAKKKKQCDVILSCYLVVGGRTSEESFINLTRVYVAVFYGYD